MRRSPFFEDVAQVELELAGEIVPVPIFYRDGTAMTALFPARLDRLRALVPDRRLIPARVAPGVGAIGISAFEYRDTDIGPYHELAVSVILHGTPGAVNLPGRSLLAGLRRGQIDAYVHHLPVTTEIALVGGRVLYNYPKFVADIGFRRDEDRCACRLDDADEWVLTLRAPRLDAPRSRQIQFFSHVWQDRQPQSAEFKLNAHGFALCSRPGAAELLLGPRHPIARELAGVLLSRRSLHYQYVPEFEGILYGPDHVSLPLAAQLLQKVVPAVPAGVEA